MRPHSGLKGEGKKEIRGASATTELKEQTMIVKELKKLRERLGAEQIKVGLRDNTLMVEARKWNGRAPIKMQVRFSVDDLASTGCEMLFIESAFHAFIFYEEEVCDG